MRAAVAENQKIYIEDVKKPELSDYDNKGAIVKVLGCGLCGSDIVKFIHNPDRIILGHEVVGEIVDIKPKFLSKFKIGDKVVQMPINNNSNKHYNEKHNNKINYSSYRSFLISFNFFFFASNNSLSNVNYNKYY